MLRLAVWTLLAGALALARPVNAQRTAPPEPTAAADTLRYTVRAGEPFLVALPQRVGTREVRYAAEQAPALSWLVDRSFFWRTLPAERGQLPVVFRRTAEGGAPLAPLVLLVDLVE